MCIQLAALSPPLGFSLFWSIWGQDWCPQGLSTLTVNDPSPETLAHSSLPPIFCPSKSPDISLSMDAASNFLTSLKVNVQTLRWWHFLGWGGQVNDDHPSVLYHTPEGVADPAEMVSSGLGVCYQWLSHFNGIRIPLEGLFKQILWTLLPEFPIQWIWGGSETTLQESSVWIPTQRLNLGLLHCRQILYHLSHQGNPLILDRILKLLQGLALIPHYLPEVISYTFPLFNPL